MVKLIFITNDNKEIEVAAEEGLSIMECAVNANIEGIDADCGGACACATCHVYIDEEAKLPEKSIIEQSMLDMADGLQENSRLSCQLIVTKDLDGLRLYIPKYQ